MFKYILLLPLCFAWNPKNYPFDPRIHTLGNHGNLGKLHSFVAPAFTTFLDKVIYKKNIRKEIIDSQGDGCRILDVGCGTGFSTSNTQGSVGIDLSDEMLNMANVLFRNKTFVRADAESYHFEQDFDVVSSMFLMHEVPQEARVRIIQHAKETALKRVIFVDISPNYLPSKMMEDGEPYIREYLKNIRKDLHDFEEEILIPGHVHIWVWNNISSNIFI